MDFASTRQYLLANAGNDGRQLLGADMGMGGIEDARVGPKLAQAFEHTLHIAALFGTREELAIGKGACSTFAETIVRIRIDALFAGDQSHVATTVVHVAPSFEQDGTNAPFDEPKGREKPARSRSHHDGLRGIGRKFPIVHGGESLLRWNLVDVEIQVELHHHLTLACVDAGVLRAQSPQLLPADGELPADLCLQLFGIAPHLRQDTDSDILYHIPFLSRIRELSNW